MGIGEQAAQPHLVGKPSGGGVDNVSFAAVRRSLTKPAIYSLKAIFGAARPKWRCLMWRLLSVLPPCGMPALCAEVCDSLPTWSPKWSAEHRSEPKYDLRPQSFQLSVKKGGPAFRITVRPFSPQVYGDPPIHTGDIEVARCQDGKQLQSLPMMAGNPIDFAASFQAEDINFDGYLDFSVLREIAGSFSSRD